MIDADGVDKTHMNEFSSSARIAHLLLLSSTFFHLPVTTGTGQQQPAHNSSAAISTYCPIDPPTITSGTSFACTLLVRVSARLQLEIVQISCVY